MLVVESGDRVVFDQATLLGISSGKKAAETALSATADTAGIETASGKDPLDVGQPGRVVLDRLRPGLFRYPLGTRSNFWNPDYYTTLLDPERGDRLLPYPESGAFRFDRRLPGSDSYFDRYILDTEKMHSRFVRNNRERLEEPLDDLVRLATNPDSPMTVTFVCNMTTPGADYFYHIDRNDGGKTARDAPPRRVDSSTVTKDVYPLSPYDLSVEEPHLWWRHMKWRAFACLNLLKRAHRSGLPADRIRVELGNELYLERSQYVTEVFPPDMRFWYEMISTLSPEEKSYYGVRKGVGGRFYVQKDSLLDYMRDNYLGLNRYSFDRGDLHPGSAYFRVNQGVADNRQDHSYESRSADFIPVINKLPVTDDYAYAAIYFADLIKHYQDEHGEKPFSKSRVAAIKSSSLVGYTLYPGVDGSRRIAQWDRVILPALKQLDELHPLAEFGGDPATVLIDAVTEHDYLFSPRYCYAKGVEAWTGANILSLLRQQHPDPMGVLARSYEFGRLKTREGDDGCPYQRCLKPQYPPYPVWHTEYAFDFLHHGNTVSRWSENVCRPSSEKSDRDNDKDVSAAVENTGLPRCELDREAYDDSWAHALITAYMTARLLEEENTASLYFFEVATLLPWGSDEGNHADSTSSVLGMWFQATRDASSRSRLQIGGENINVPDSAPFSLPDQHRDCEHSEFMPVFPSPLAGELPGVIGWRFEGKDTEGVYFSRYLLLNLKPEAVTLKITGDSRQYRFRSDSVLSVLAGDLSSRAQPKPITTPRSPVSPVFMPARSLILVEFSSPGGDDTRTMPESFRDGKND